MKAKGINCKVVKTGLKICEPNPFLGATSDGIIKLDDGTEGLIEIKRGARWLSGRVSDSGARGRGFETYRRRVVSLSKTLYSPKVLVNYLGSDGSVPI